MKRKTRAELTASMGRNIAGAKVHAIKVLHPSWEWHEIAERLAQDLGISYSQAIDIVYAELKTKSNPTPDEWDDIADEGARLGSIQARALGRSEREHRARARYFNVSWYSKRKGGRVGFIRPIEATSAADAKQQARAMVTNEKPVNIVAKEVTSNPADKRFTVSGYTKAGQYHALDITASSKARALAMARAQNRAVSDKSLRVVKWIVTEVKSNPKKIQRRELSVPDRHQLRIARDTLKMSDAGARIMGGPTKEEAREIILRLTGKRAQENPGLIALAEGMQAADYLGKRFKARNPKINPGFFTTTRQRKPKAGSEDYLGRKANPKNKANDDWWIARVREVFPAVTDEMPSKRFAESYSYLLERMETPQAKRIMRKMYGVKYANLQFRTSFNPNDSSVRSPTRTSTEVKSPTKTSTSTWAKTTGNITVTGGAGAGATTRVTVRRNPGEYEQSVKIIESAIRKAVARARRQGTVGMSAANLKQLLSTIDLRGVNLAGPGAFNRAFDEALARFQRTAKFRIYNPSVTALAETFQGRASGAVKEFKAASAAPSDLARIGKLVFLKLKDSRRQIAAPGAMVAVDTKGKLWIVSQRAPMFSKKARPGEALDFGEIERICYLTAKQHIESGKLTEYVHEFGENGGKRPRLLVDHEGMPILRGGEYQIRAEGIVD